MDLIARTITTPRLLSRFSWIVSGVTAVGILAFGVPPIALFVVGWGGAIVLGTTTPWARRRLGRR